MKVFIASMLIVLALMLTGCGGNAALKREISSVIDVNTRPGRVCQNTDTHGGFHGDGATLAILEFTDAELLDEIEQSDEWKPLPLSDNMVMLLEHTGGVMSEQGGIKIPKIEGYYRFIDRHSEATDKKDEAAVLSRYSYNYTLAIYDSGHNMLYYVKIDT